MRDWAISDSGMAVATWLSFAVALVGLGAAILFFLLPWTDARRAAEREQAATVFGSVDETEDGYNLSVSNRSNAPIYNLTALMAPAAGMPGVPAAKASTTYLQPAPEKFGLGVAVEGKLPSGEAVPVPRNSSNWIIRIEFQDANAEWWHRAYQVPSLRAMGP